MPSSIPLLLLSAALLPFTTASPVAPFPTAAQLPGLILNGTTSSSLAQGTAVLPPELPSTSTTSWIERRHHTTTSKSAPKPTTTTGKPAPKVTTTTSKPTPTGPAVTNPTALAFYTSSLTAGSAGRSDSSSYTCYSGPATSFPSFASWMSFDAMFALNNQTMLAWLYDAAEVATVTGDLHAAVVAVSQSALIDARFILAIMMQESGGNVYVECTNNGEENCGLLQSNSGGISLSAGSPITYAVIQQMLVDGMQGTQTGASGFVQLLNDEAGQPSTYGNPYVAARAYNSGSVDLSDLSTALGATASYVSDVANRLLGWDGTGEGSAACGFAY